MVQESSQNSRYFHTASTEAMFIFQTTTRVGFRVRRVKNFHISSHRTTTETATVTETAAATATAVEQPPPMSCVLLMFWCFCRICGSRFSNTRTVPS